MNQEARNTGKAATSNTYWSPITGLPRRSSRKVGSRFTHHLQLILVAFLIADIPHSLYAATDVWQGGASGAWFTPGNWTLGLPGTTDIAQFGTNGTNTTIGINMASASTNNGSNNEAVGAIDILSTRGAALTINDSSATAGTLTLNGAAVTLNDASTLSDVIIHNNSIRNLTLASGTGTMTVALGDTTNNIISIESSGGVTISSIITGASKQLTLTGGGVGVLTLSGANTFSGGMTLSAGTLALGVGSVVSGGVVTSGPVGTGTLTLNGGTLRSDSATTGGDRIINNNLSLSGSITLGDATNTGILTFDNTSLTTKSAALAADTTLTTSSAVIVANAISGNFNLTKAGVSSLTLSGNNTFGSGKTFELSSGTLNINSATALGAGTFQIDSGTTIDSTATFTNQTLTNNNALALNGNFTFTGTNNLNLGTGAATLGGAAGTSRTITTTASTLTIGGVISNGTTANSITKAGAGTLVLNGANLFTGGVTLNAGTLTLGNATALGPAANATVTFGSGSTGKLQLNGNDVTIVDLNTNATVGTPIIESGSGTAGTDTLTVNTASTDTYAGLLQNGSTRKLALTKAGAGTLTLSGANTYTGGTSVTGGILQLGSNGVVSGGAISTGPVGAGTLTLGDGTTLRSNGSTARTIQNNLSLSGAITLGATATQTGALTFNSTDGTNSLGTAATAALTGDTTLTTNVAVTIADAISGSFNLIKAGANTLTLSGTNTFGSGKTFELSAGTLNINSATALGVGTFQIDGGTTIDSTAAFTNQLLTNNNALTINGNFTFTGTNNLNLGTGAVSLGTASGTSRTITVSADTLTIGGTISDGTTATSIVKAGGGTLALTGSNNYDGGTTLNAGTLAIGNNSALGTNTLTLGGASTVQSTNSTARSLSNNVLVTSTGTMAFAGAGDLSFGSLTLNAATTFNVTNGSTTFSSVGQDSARALTKLGSGILVISGNKTTTGAVDIQGGVFAVAGAYTTSGNLQLDGGVLARNGSITQNLGTGNGQVQWISGKSGGFAAYGSNATWGNAANNLTVNIGNAGATETFGATNFLSSGQTLLLGSTISNGTVDFQNGLDLNATSQTVQVTRSAVSSAGVDAKLSGAITNGSLSKTGTGILELTSNSNTYGGGTTVSAGTLLADNSSSSASATGSGAITVNATGTLGGTGFINAGANTSTVDGTLLGGAGSAASGSLHIQSAVQMNSGSIVELALSSSSSSTLAVSGSGSLLLQSDQQFAFIDLGAVTNHSYTLATGMNQGSLDTSGFTINQAIDPNWAGSFSYSGGTLSVTLSEVPEPSTYAAAALACLTVAYTLRRRFLNRRATA